MPIPEIAPTSLDDIEPLGKFLTAGFGTPPDAPFARPDVLRWKYFPETPPPFPLSYVAKAEGEIVGHVGVAPARFLGAGLASEIPAIHMIDWLRDPACPSLGVALMRRVHRLTDVQFAIYGSAAAQKVMRASGYAPIQAIPLWRRLLRPSAHVRLQPGFKGWAKFARDLIPCGGGGPTGDFAFEETDRFDDRVADLSSRSPSSGDTIVTARDQARLNHLLGCPAVRMIGGWITTRRRETAGWAILCLLERDGVRFGKVVDLSLATDDPGGWAGVIGALTARLRAEGAEVIDAFHGDPLASEGFRRRGFRAIDRLDLLMRDREAKLPAGASYHLTPIEADYASL